MQLLPNNDELEPQYLQEMSESVRRIYNAQQQKDALLL